MKEKIVNIADKIIEYCLYGMIFIIPKSKAAIEIFACLAIFVFLIKKILKPDFKFLKSFPSVFLLFFIFFNALSVLNSGPLIKKSLIALICKWIEYGLIFLIVQDTLRTRLRVRIAVYILLIFGFIAGIDGLSQKIIGIEFLWDNSMAASKNGLMGITGPFRHYNDFGTYLLVIISLVMGIWLSNNSKLTVRFLIFLCLSPLVIALLLTYSRGAWVGFAFSSLLMLVISRRLKLLIPLSAIFIVLLLFVPGARERQIATFQLHSQEPIVWYDADRFRVWQTAFKMIRESPLLGKGVGTFMAYLSEDNPMISVQYAHNCFLQIWAESGIFSLLSFLAFAGTVLYQGCKKFRKNNDFVLLGLISGMFGFLVHSFFDTNLYSLQLSVLFWSCMGLIYAKIIFNKC